jgi:hypothetical protein
MRRRAAWGAAGLTLAWLLLVRAAAAQVPEAAATDSTVDSAGAAPAHTLMAPVVAVLNCARDRALAAGFTVEGSPQDASRSLLAWRAHLQAIDAEEYDAVLVRAWPGGQAPRLDVEATAVIGRPLITTRAGSQARPPSAQGFALRNTIRKECGKLAPRE